ncbi:MAG: epoxide hydrolase [Rhodobiaceae bacterium]|nr:epoxide hydrolase [Rhodobiaceae bacterium]
MNDSTEAVPFKIDIEEEKLNDVQERLKKSRLSEDFGNQDWKYGTERNYLSEILKYWIQNYNWRDQEEKINSFPHYKCEIDGNPIHFIHVKGSGKNAKPIILSHGWPWTFWDYQKIIDPLANPEKYGGDSEDSFDVIVPSLPGYGFSTPLKKTGINFWETSDLWVSLMKDVLGYEKFFAHGGDWGSLVTLQLGHKYSEIVPALHTHTTINLDFFERPVPTEDDFSESEKKLHHRNVEFWTEGHGYFQIQATKPQTLSYGLNDSPIGLCAWLIEKRRSWGDCGNDIESRFSKDDLINTTMIYWLSESFGTSARYYYEAMHNMWKASHDRTPIVESAVGFTVFEGDIIFRPKKLMAEANNLQYWNVTEKGGHFAPMEEPEFLVKEIRKFFSSYRSLV